MAGELMEKVVVDVQERNPHLALDSIEFKAEVLCLVISFADMPEDSAEIRSGLAVETGYSDDFVGSILTGLEAGGALSSRNQMNAALVADLSAENGGISLACLVSISLGYATYNADRHTFSLTEAGKLYVEQKLLKGKA